MKIVLAFLLSLLAFAAQSQEIKGIRIGMTKAEVEAIHPNLSGRTFTVGGVPSMFKTAKIVSYDENDRVRSMTFFFKNEGFMDIFRALKSKYPEMKCETSEVTNRMGAKFEQVECSYGLLSLQRIQDVVDEGVLSMHDPEFIKTQAEKRKAKVSGDI